MFQLEQIEEAMETEYVQLAKDWHTGDNTGLGLFASMELIIDNPHRDRIVVEIQERLRQCEQHRTDLEFILRDEPILRNFLEFAKKTEIVSDYGR